MRKKFLAGATILALLLNAPQVQAEDDVVIFGGEFEDETAPPEQKPKPVKKLPPEEKPTPAKPAPPKLPKPEESNPNPTPPTQPQENLPTEEDDDLGDVLVFDDLSNLPKSEPEPIQEPTVEPTPAEIERPFADKEPTEITDKREPVNEPVIVVPPPTQPTLPEQPIQPAIQTEPAIQPTPSNSTERTNTPTQKPLKTLKPRFVKLAVDDTYTYYLDKTSVQWKRMPYSSSEYVADVWIRMIENKPKTLDKDMANYGEENFNAEISFANEQGYQYSPEDLQVLKHQSYVLEHYYLRPKTKQIQFFCELEVFGRPQNTINERAYDYKNWENLVPGSVESVIYNTVIKIIGKGKSDEKGHMTFIDMLEEYGRISLR